jgi:(R,R)-butanediol dehydrogenase/meso-butanediol dehydrogenase/diacetyl reductase
MRAGVLYGLGDLRVEDRPEPRCGPGEVVIEVAYNGLCGTDATEYAKGSILVPLAERHPGSGHVGATILGHEFVGTVVAAGEDTSARLGDRVACGAGVSCGRCRWCATGRTNLCAEYFTLGLSTHGGLAEFAAAPAAICRAIPDGCGDQDAALAQPLAVGLHAVRRAGVRPGDRVVLLGVGAIGSFIAAGLRAHDGPVVAVDVNPARLAVAAALGVPTVRLVAPDAGAAELRDMLPDEPDVVFETSGVTGAAERAFAVTARGGTTVLVGLNQTPQPLNLASLVLREVDVRTTVAHVCDEDLAAALDLLTANPLAELLVDRIVPLADVVAAGFEPLAAGTVSGKVLVDPRHG